MNRVIRQTAVWAALAALCGCGTNRALNAPQASMIAAGMAGEAHARQLEAALTDGQLADLLDVDVRAKLPTSLAVARLWTPGRGGWAALEDVSADELAAWRDAVAGMEGITGVRPVSGLAMAGSERPTLHALRQAAARMNCELLLAYLQADAAVDNYNDAAVLYWTGLGLWLVPGNVLEHKTVMQAVLLDTRTGMILGTATGDAHLRRAYPAAFESQRRAELTRQAPLEALAKLQTDAAGMLPRVLAAAQLK